jgi:glycosyltransferase involved in cell wall biosynthesis
MNLESPLNPSHNDNPFNDEGEVELSVVMPCLNEELTLAPCIERAQGCLREMKVLGEILVADNGSEDNSQQIALKHGARVVKVPHKGYGSALMGGIEAARGRYVIMGDADMSYDFGALAPFLERLRAGDELVMGNRFQGGIAPGAMKPLHRYLGNPVLTGIGRLFFGSPCGDFHCGLRGFNRQSILTLNLRTTGMEFASEMVVKATLYGLRISEVPTTLRPDGRDRPPHLRSWRDGWRHLRFLLLYSPRWLFLYPGIFLMLMGIGIGLWLLPGPKSVGNLRLDVHTLLYAALSIVVGFQGVCFGLFTKIFAISEGLLPDSPRLDKMFRFITLETGLLIGFLLLLLGIVGSIAALGAWSRTDYGPLDPSQTLRLVIPAVTALMLGAQTILSSFFLSVLGLRRR